METTRLDKWLWAARFYKTRSIAKKAIDGGKVHCDGIKGKANRQVIVGMEIRLMQGHQQKTVEVLDLSEQRGPAATAQKLYRETSESIAKREELKAQRQSMPFSNTKPDKKQRRQIHKFLREQE
ncbi:RNA-binding S4 domain-containing protein [Kangiella sp. HZ709]|uniref:RNA-binding S4 domain-containing protein n=1 Tax=Kangiella sp. HZ709 TaxID=2666328 RepID=UPI0012B1147D|nr:S4 domain-containing protein [Kangiella sp. HZ709]MRX28214.1 RNA-binding protein [Kangiella sp. HZ709]